MNDLGHKQAIACLGISEALLGLNSALEAKEKLIDALYLLDQEALLEKKRFSFAKVFRRSKVAPEVMAHASSGDMDLEQLQILIKVLELHLDLRSLINEALILGPYDDIASAEMGTSRAVWRKHLAEVRIVLKNLAALLKAEASKRYRDLPWELKDRIYLATSCI